MEVLLVHQEAGVVELADIRVIRLVVEIRAVVVGPRRPVKRGKDEDKRREERENEPCGASLGCRDVEQETQ